MITVDPMKWHGNYVSIKEDYIVEESHLLKCIAEGGNLCICSCKDCASNGKCLCLECACHEVSYKGDH